MERMVIYDIISGLVKQILKCSNCVVSKSPDGNLVTFTINNYPSFPQGDETDVIVSYPFTWLELTDSNGKVSIKPNRISSNDVRFWQGNIGTPFPHPYIWNDGRPDFGGANKGVFTVQEMLMHLILTLRYQNVNEHSMRSSNNLGGTGIEILDNAKNQSIRVNEKYGLNSQISAKELSQWIDAQFRLRVSMLEWQGE